MSELRVYDTEGEPYGGGERDDRIAAFAFAGVRVAVDAERPELVAFFRASEAGARIDQYYAVYRADSTVGLFAAFRDALAVWADREGVDLSTAHPDTRFLPLLSERRPDPPGAAFERDTLAELLADGRTLDAAVPDAGAALGLLRRAVVAGDATTVAVSDTGRKSGLAAYDLVVEPDGADGLDVRGVGEPTFEAAVERRAERVVAERAADADDAVERWRARTDVSDTEVRSRLQAEMPILTEASGTVGAPVLACLAVALLAGVALGVALASSVVPPGPVGVFSELVDTLPELAGVLSV